MGNSTLFSGMLGILVGETMNLPTVLSNTEKYHPSIVELPFEAKFWNRITYCCSLFVIGLVVMICHRYCVSYLSLSFGLPASSIVKKNASPRFCTLAAKMSW